MIPKHPASERSAAWFHLGLAVYYGAGLVFHAVSTVRHWYDREPIRVSLDADVAADRILEP